MTKSRKDDCQGLHASEYAAAPPVKRTKTEAFDWRLLASIAGVGGMRIDLSDGQVTLDAAAARQHHLHPQVEQALEFDAWLSLLCEVDRLRVHSLLRTGLRAGCTELAVVRMGWARDGEPPTLELYFMPDPDGGDILCASRDVTVAQSLEEARRHRAAAERASRAKSEFMSQVSHELRTPLNSILGFAQLMAMDADQPISGMQKDRLQVLHRSGLRLLSLVDQLLQIGRIEHGRTSLRPRSVNVHTLIRRCIASMAPMAEQQDIAIEIDLMGDGASAVRADANALEQVLVNLLSNGIKYNRKGGRLTVRYRITEAGEITVDDTGHGLSASQVAQLFQPFNRLDAKQTAVEGTGLGLVISRQLVEAMSGALHVWSEPEVGTRFRITLPLARSMRAEESDPLPIGMPSKWALDGQFRVLYVEDDEVNVVLLDQVFAMQADWQLIVAMTGAKGLAEAVRQQPDVILLDLMLPDMSGWEVLKLLKAGQRTRHIPVVAVSADAMPATTRRGRSAGFVDYWTKPLDLAAIITRLKMMSTSMTPR